jgi:hypothetical protein
LVDRLEIPLHTNGSENDILCQVTRRKVSGGTRSDLASDQTLLVASAQNESAPETEALPNFNRSEPQAATLVGLTSRSFRSLAGLFLVVGLLLAADGQPSLLRLDRKISASDSADRGICAAPVRSRHCSRDNTGRVNRALTHYPAYMKL